MQYLQTLISGALQTVPMVTLETFIKKLNSLYMKYRFFWLMVQLYIFTSFNIFNSYSAEDVVHEPFPVAQVPLLSVKIQLTEN